MLGLRDMLARRTRAVWLMWAVGATSAAMVVTLSITTALGARPAGEPSDVPAELPALILTLDAVLSVITLSALASVALLAVRERLRDIGVLRTVGLTPNEVTVSLTGSHVLLAFLSACLSIPVGLGLYLAIYTASGADTGPETGLAPWWAIALIPVAVTMAAAIMTSIPARVANRIAAADAVRVE
jgi:putative ABC transport system permease protein